MRDKTIPEEGLEKAELQLNIMEQMQNNDITHLTGNHYGMKQYRKTLTEHLINTKLKNGLKIEKCIIKH